MADKKPSKMGRPSKYKEEFVGEVKKLAMLGLTDLEMAAYFEVNESTITRWKQTKPDFCMALKEGKVLADGNVVDSLYKQATEGNVTACIFWLKNRRPSQWRDKPEDVVVSTDEEVGEEFL